MRTVVYVEFTELALKRGHANEIKPGDRDENYLFLFVWAA